MINLDNLKIRNMEKKDKNSILELFQILNKSDNLEISITEELIDYFLGKPEFAQGIFVVGYEDGLVGLGTCITTGSNNEAGIELSIHPEYRGEGIEEKLYEVLLEQANKEETKKLVSGADKTQEYLTTFFDKVGFEEFEYMWKMRVSVKEDIDEELDLDGVKFIEATKDDLNLIVDLMNDGFREGREDKYKTDVFESRFADPNNYIYLLEKDGELIATANISKQEEFSNAYISNLAVYKKYRGKGFGKLLLNLCIDKIRQQGLKTANLHVVGTNEKAMGLYKNAGFREYNTTIRYEKFL